MVAARSTSWRMGIAPRAGARQRDAAVRLPSSVWISLLGDPETVASYYRNVFRRGPGEDWPWLGSPSGTRSAQLPASRHIGQGTRSIAAPVLRDRLPRALR